jgi:RHS repeat-associated protein
VRVRTHRRGALDHHKHLQSNSLREHLDSARFFPHPGRASRNRWATWAGSYRGTGLYQVRNRWYDPLVGRFASEDPIGLEGGINPYVYAGNDPVDYTDPMGLDCMYSDGIDLTASIRPSRSAEFTPRMEVPIP